MLAMTGGIITAELTNEIRRARLQRQCPHCECSGHETDARYCKFCGGSLEPATDNTLDPDLARDKLD